MSALRLSWRPEIEKSLHSAVLMACNGKFIKLLQMPEDRRKMFKRKLSYGWEEVKQILAKEYPDFQPTRLQVSDKWRKSKAAQYIMSSSSSSYFDLTDAVRIKNEENGQERFFNFDLLGESEDPNYVCPHELAKQQGNTDSAVRTEWCPKAEASLHRAVLMANDGKFIDLLQLPEDERKSKVKELTFGWEEVRQIVTEEHPDFEPTRQQVSHKWRKSMKAEKAKRAKMKEDIKETINGSHAQFPMPSLPVDFDPSEAGWADNDDVDDDQQNYVEVKIKRKPSATKKAESDKALMIQEKKLEMMEEEKMSIKRLEEKTIEMLEAEHERRLALMEEESDLKRRLIKEVHDQNLIFFGEQYRKKP